MSETSTHKKPCCSDRLSGFQHFWPLDDSASGYGVALYLGTSLITCHLFNLENNDLLDSQRIRGDFKSLSANELNSVINDLFILLAKTAGIKLSKLTTAVVSGTTAMECMAAGVNPDDYQCNSDEEVELLGCDVEYLMAGPSSIAVGEAYYIPCLSTKIGGDFLCSLLAIDILSVEQPLIFINTGPDEDTDTVLAYGNKECLTIGVLPKGMTEEEAIPRLLDECDTRVEDVANVLYTGIGKPKLPAILEERSHYVEGAALEGSSAVLLSEIAEDQLCRIVDTCRIVRL